MTPWVSLLKTLVMKKMILTYCFMLASFIVMSQSVPAKDALKNEGKTITVCDKIYGGIFMSRSGSQPTFLNVGAAYPNSPLTILIWGNDRRKFKWKPEEYFKDKKVCITGVIKKYNGKAEMVVTDPAQIMIAE
jgi:hypothetical protein